MNTFAKVIKGKVNKFLEIYPLSGLIKGGRVEFRVKFFGEYLTNVGYFVVQVFIICILCPPPVPAAGVQNMHPPLTTEAH